MFRLVCSACLAAILVLPAGCGNSSGGGAAQTTASPQLVGGTLRPDEDAYIATAASAPSGPAAEEVDAPLSYLAGRF